MPNDVIYDIETYKNIFCATFLDPRTRQHKTFEMSDRRDDWAEFKQFVKRCQENFTRWVGFNNYYFDYQIIHKLLSYEKFAQVGDKAGFAYEVAQKIINMGKEEKFLHVVWSHEHLVPQIDLFRIHHFDNNARSTSLKKLEFNMQSRTIQDLPYPIGSYLNHAEKDVLIRYNIHDCSCTADFYMQSQDMIKFREQLTSKYARDFMNHNDTKIGKDYFIMELENANIKCFTTEGGRKEPVQTKRPFIRVNEIIFPYVKFERAEFNAVLSWLRKQVITQTKGVFTEIDDLGELEKYADLKKVKGKVRNLNCIVDNFKFVFGTGGIHGSIDPTIIEDDENLAIIDYDVTSLYPSIAIANSVFPKHLTAKFCEIYENMKRQRLSYAKGTPENAMLKLALNGVYGDSNNPYSPFYDPQYTMTITINGQLMLCMLAEELLGVEGLKLLQINTDGLTIRVPRNQINQVEYINRCWCALTALELERADYNKFFVRDVNNYLGLYTDGKTKRKGEYEYNMAWHQDRSSLIIQKAAEAHLIKGVDIDWFIRNHGDVNDFMLRTNVPRSSRLIMEYPNNTQKLQNTTRYYMSKKGGQLVKIMPPLNRFKTMEQQELEARTPAQKKKFLSLKLRREKLGVAEGERIINIQDGFLATDMNTMGELKDIDFDWYINETKKLVDPLWAGAYSDLIS